jgi:hypothetical protein
MVFALSRVVEKIIFCWLVFMNIQKWRKKWFTIMWKKIMSDARATREKS